MSKHKRLELALKYVKVLARKVLNFKIIDNYLQTFT